MRTSRHLGTCLPHAKAILCQLKFIGAIVKNFVKNIQNLILCMWNNFWSIYFLNIYINSINFFDKSYLIDHLKLYVVTLILSNSVMLLAYVLHILFGITL